MFTSTHRSPAQSAIVVAIFCLAAVGCGGGPEIPELYSVTGKVTYQGKPVPNAKLVFIPEKEDKKEAGKPGNRPAAETNENGEYTVLWGQDAEGAPAGKYTITILAYAPYGPGDDTESAPPSLIPLKYNNPKTSGLTREVKEDDNVFNFDLDDAAAGGGGFRAGKRDD